MQPTSGGDPFDGEPEQQALFGWADTAPTAPPEGDGGFRKSATARRMLDIREVYGEPAALASRRGQQILARLPGVPITEVAGHWRIPSLHGNAGSVARWTRIKRETLVLGVRQSLITRPNGRSADFIAPGASNGCAMACAYCYVPRRKGYANPITLFTNIEAIIAHIQRHVRAQGAKQEPNQCDRDAWVYDVSENGDCSVDALICDNTADLIAAFRALPTAKASFATKFVNPDLLGLDPGGRTRVRFSLMPQDDSRLLDIRTSPVARRIAAAADFLDAGYEVHFNLSPWCAAGLAAGLGGAAHPSRRRGAGPGEGAGCRRSHSADPQRATPRGQSGLAPPGRGRPVAARRAGDQTLAERCGQRPLRASGQAAGHRQAP